MKNPVLIHKHLIIRAEANRVPTDEEQLTSWLTEFIDSIGMKILMGPYVKYCTMEGNRGITGIAVIETSHIAIHIWDEMSPALVQCDVYSCAEFSSSEVLMEFVVMEPTKIEHMLLDRAEEIKTITQTTSS